MNPHKSRQSPNTHTSKDAQSSSAKALAGVAAPQLPLEEQGKASRGGALLRIGTGVSALKSTSSGAIPADTLNHPDWQRLFSAANENTFFQILLSAKLDSTVRRHASLCIFRTCLEGRAYNGPHADCWPLCLADNVAFALLLAADSEITNACLNELAATKKLSQREKNARYYDINNACSVLMQVVPPTREDAFNILMGAFSFEDPTWKKRALMPQLSGTDNLSTDVRFGTMSRVFEALDKMFETLDKMRERGRDEIRSTHFQNAASRLAANELSPAEALVDQLGYPVATWSRVSDSWKANLLNVLLQRAADENDRLRAGRLDPLEKAHTTTDFLRRLVRADLSSSSEHAVSNPILNYLTSGLVRLGVAPVPTHLTCTLYDQLDSRELKLRLAQTVVTRGSLFSSGHRLDDADMAETAVECARLIQRMKGLKKDFPMTGYGGSEAYAEGLARIVGEQLRFLATTYYDTTKWGQRMPHIEWLKKHQQTIVDNPFSDAVLEDAEKHTRWG